MGRYMSVLDDKNPLLLSLKKRRPTSQIKTGDVSVAVARTQPLLEPASVRRTTRVLFVTTDTAILNQTNKTLDGFTAIADMFDEVHIMVLRTGIAAKYPVLRVSKQTWLYTVTANHDWQLPFRAWHMMKKELVFVDGFRPDLIVARDQFISAFVVYVAGRHFHRPTQLHVNERLFARRRLTALLSRMLTGKFLSIRTMTENCSKEIRLRHHQITDCSPLPQFRDYLLRFTGEQRSVLAEKYRQFNFFILYVGNFTHTSSAFYAIDAVRDILQNPRVAFVMVGDGLAVGECLRRAELLKIKHQVIVERQVPDIDSYISSADILLVTDTDAAADEIVLKGAAAGAPMVMTNTILREDWFAADDTVIKVSNRNIIKTSDALRGLLQDVTLRYRLRYRVRQVAESILPVDITQYEISFRDSLEEAIVTYEMNNN